MARTLLASIASGLLASSALSAVAQAPTAAAPDRRAFEVGTPFVIRYPFAGSREQSFVWAITQDAKGLMYFGSEAGVSRFDGVDWRHLPLANGSAARCLTAAKAPGEGGERIYVGGQGEVGYVEERIGGARYVSLVPEIAPEDRRFYDVWRCHATARGVFFQSNQRIFLWDGEDMRSFAPSTAFHRLLEVGGELYADEVGRGLSRFDGEGWRPLAGSEALAGTRVEAALACCEGEEVVFATRARGLWRYDGRRFRPFPTEADAYLVERELYNGVLLADGQLALATLRGGLVIVDRQGAARQVVRRSTGLTSDSVLSLYRDREDGLWLGQPSQIARVEPTTPLTSFDTASGLLGLPLSAARFAGALFVGTTKGVYELVPRSTADFTESAGFRPVPELTSQAWDLAVVGDRLLAATTDGVYEIDPGRRSRLAFEGRSVALHPSRLDPDRLYVGLSPGLASLRRTGDRWGLERSYPEIIDEVPRLAEDIDGRLWVGTRLNGLLQLELDPVSGRAVERWRLGADDPRLAGPGPPWVFDTSRGLLVTTGRGIFRIELDGPELVPETAFGAAFADGSRYVSYLAEDPDGHLWITSGGDTGLGVALRLGPGVYRWEPRPYHRLPAAHVSSLLPEADGVLWLTILDRLVRYDPRRERSHDVEPTAYLRRVRSLGGETLIEAPTAAAGATPVLEPWQNALRFELSTLSFDGGPVNVFRSKLEGFDADWSPWSNESWRDYTNLPPGSYAFRLRARNVYHQESAETVFRFQIAPPWYLEPWFLLAAAALSAAAVVAAARRWGRKVVHKARREAENERRQHELEAARRVQQSLLPAELPNLSGLDVAAYQRTASEVGGDYYDFFPQADGRLFLAIGDATAHGAPAGLMVAVTKTALLTIHDDDLPRLLRVLNTAIRQVGLEDELNMSLMLAEIRPDPLSKRTFVRVAGGGTVSVHLLRAGGQVETLPVSGLPLGALWYSEYRGLTSRLSAGDVLIFLTSGLLDLVDPGGEPFGTERLAARLEELGRRYRAAGSAASAQEVLDDLVAAGDAWARGEPLVDDVTLVVLKVEHGGEPSEDEPAEPPAGAG